MITVETERKVPKFEINEDITFIVNLPKDSPEVDYTIKINRMQDIATGSIPSGSRRVKIKAKADRPCFVEMSVSYGDTVHEAAAAVAPEKITATSPPGSRTGRWMREA